MNEKCWFCKKHVRWYHSKFDMNRLNHPLIYGYAHTNCAVAHLFETVEENRQDFQSHRHRENGWILIWGKSDDKEDWV